MARISSQIRLAEHAALACVRDCVADLEKTSESISAAGLFQVRQQESKAGEQGMYRKSGECAGLRKAAGQHQAAVSFFGQRGCAVLAGGNALFGELARTRTPPLCPSAHHSPSRARRAAQDCCGKARRCARHSSCSAKLLVHTGMHLQRVQSRTRGAPCLGRPSRAAPRGSVRPQSGMKRLLAELEHALYAQHAAHAHSHFAPAAGASWRQLYTVR